GISTERSTSLPDRRTAAILATASTCPETQWPPSSSPTRSARSRFTLPPGTSFPRVVWRSVSGTAVAWLSPACTRSTVRQTPLTATEAPAAGGASKPARMASRAAGGASGAGRTMASTHPTRSTMPLNIALFLERALDPEIAAHAARHERLQLDRLVETRASEIARPRRGARTSQDPGRDSHRDPVREPFAKHRRVHRRPPFHEQGEPSFPGKLAEEGLERHVPRAVRSEGPDAHAQRLQRLDRPAILRDGRDQERRLMRRPDESRARRNAKARVEHDAKRIPPLPEPHRQLRIVLQHRADADQDGVVLRPEPMAESLLLIASQTARFSGVARHAAVERDHRLEHHPGEPLTLELEVGRIELLAFLAADVLDHLDARGAQRRDPAPV